MKDPLHNRVLFKCARPLLFVMAALFLSVSLPAQLVINEVSQGSSGTKEYVELLTVGTPGCSSIPTVDLRGWYLDDNNGNHATGSGTGIATGCLRFTNDPMWSAVPIGTLILIYNDGDMEPGIPAQDLSLGDGNCRLVIPVSNCTLIEKNTSAPSTATSIYPTSGFTTCGTWSTVGMSNTDDSFQTLNPSSTLVHSVSYGNNTQNQIIYFSGGSAGQVIFMTNASNNNPAVQANWVRMPVAGNETPGLPNNAANASWINSMNNNCTALTPLTVSAVAGSQTCSCNGTATATASGSTGPYTYSWSPSGGNSATATGLCPGTYVVTATSLSGCTETATVNIIAPPPLVLSANSSAVSCHGGNNGSATVNVTGGTGIYTYSWAPTGGTNATATGLLAGQYTVTVTDNGGCTDNVIVNITEPSAINIVPSQTNVSCSGGNDGSASVAVSGGAGGYLYSWSPSVGTGATVSGLAQGTYVVTVTDANNCTATHTFNITQPPVMTVSAGTGGNVCINGSIALNATASGSYTSVSWQGGTGIFSAPGALSTNYSPGSGDNGNVILTVTVTDACNNTISSQVTVNVIPLPNAQIIPGSLTTFCPGGQVVLNASGGTTYLWSTGATSDSIVATTAGTYTLTSTTSCGSDTASITVTVLPLPNAQITASGPTTLCPGDSVTLTASGGNMYQWSTGSSNTSITVQTAGTYSVVVGNSCSNDTAYITTTVMPSPNAQITSSGPTTFCQGDSITLSASGGNSYVWSTGATSTSITVSNAGSYYVVATVSCGSDTAFQSLVVNPLPNAQITASGPTTICSGDSVTFTASGGTSYLWSTGATSTSITVHTAGNYYVVATSPCGNDTAFQSVQTNALPTATITASGPTTFCQGNNVTLTASGGTSYLWSNAATTPSITATTAGSYSVIVTNACGTANAQQVITILPLPAPAIAVSGPLTFCQGDSVTLTASGGASYLWSTGSTSTSITVNTSGTYSVAVTNSCGTASTQQTVNVLAQPVAAITASGPVSFCAGNNVTLTASGGTSYLWSNGSTSSSITVNAAGTYSVTVTNACGSASSSQTVSVLPLPVAQASGGTVICPGQQTTLTASGGSTYLWSNGATSSSITVSTPGTYTVVATNSCGSDTAQVVVSPSVVSANFTATPDSGSVPLPVSFIDNSINGVTWSWNFGDGNFSSASDPSNTFDAPGTYVVILTVTNADGCTDSASGVIIVDDIPAVIEIPNVFTPNADGTNDLFLPKIEGLSELHLEIYDRWGVLMHTIVSVNEGWDGKNTSGNAATDGTYYYILSGTAYNGKTYNAKGFFTLIH